jgi:2-amino-4-hydroxy-6-hydroxymethyldihydropteridine diphosphokinase
MSHAIWMPAYIGVGSNLDAPDSQVNRGIDALRTIVKTRLVTRSHLYLSKPMGPQDQPHFVNAVAGLLTQLDAHGLLSELKALESKLGREPQSVRWGPRKIDFDLLVFGSERIATAALQVPHPGIAERAFVVVPLLEIAPHLEIPDRGSVDTLLSRIDRESVTRL